MWHVGMDLHRRTVVIAAVDDGGQVRDPITLSCSDTAAIMTTLQGLRPFRAVVEASSSYGWLYDLLAPHGTVLLAHPLKLRAMIQRRSKTDKLDALLLAHLLRLNQVPLAYVPPLNYRTLRARMRYRVRLGRQLTDVKIGLQMLLGQHNRTMPYRNVGGVGGRRWMAAQTFDEVDDQVRDDLLDRFDLYEGQIDGLEAQYAGLRVAHPEVEALLDIQGMGLYTALLIVGELGEVERFRHARQVGAYAGLTATVNQSGGHSYHGHISRQGSPWLRWALVQVAMKAVRGDDVRLRNFYERIRKRHGAKIARVAVARKLAEICWVRLRRWHRAHAG